jgi:hypothetical protein
MQQVQAIIQTCIDFRVQEALKNFLEVPLNLYAVEIRSDDGGVKKIFEAGADRDLIFQNYEKIIKEQGASKIILINHTDCAAYGGSKAFESLEKEIHEHEIQIRHAVSAVKAKFPDIEVEAYLVILSNPPTIQKVV